MSSNHSEHRRRAEEKLASLRAQRDGIDRKVKELEGFLVILAEFEGNGKPATADRSASVMDHIVAILREANGKAMSAKDVTARIKASGFDHSGKVPLGIRVSTELYRQAKAGRRGITKTRPGKYALKESASAG